LAFNDLRLERIFIIAAIRARVNRFGIFSCCKPYRFFPVGKDCHVPSISLEYKRSAMEFRGINLFV